MRIWVTVPLAFALVLVLGGCGGKADKAEPAGADDSTADAKVADAKGGKDAPVALVRTALAEFGATSDALTLYGTAEAGPGGERAISTPREAVLVSILAPNGTAVGAGTAIAMIRPSSTGRADAAKAASDVAVASAALARAKRLRADGLVSNADVETARGTFNTARAVSVSLNGSGGTLRAPVAGTVQALNTRPGDTIAAGATVATVAVAGERRARFGVDPAVAARIHPGQAIHIEAVNGSKPVDATVVGIDPQVDAATRLAAVFARVPGSIAVGEPLRARVTVGTTTSGLTIPYAALLDDGGKSYVFVVDKGVSRRRDVAPGNSNGDRIAILRGLNAGEHVVTEGGTALEDGLAVREDGRLVGQHK